MANPNQYSLAPMKARLGAFVIDISLFFVSFLLGHMMFFFIVFFKKKSPFALKKTQALSSIVDYITTTKTFLLMSLLLIAAYLLLQIFSKGQSVGKKLFGLLVIDKFGNAPSILQVIVRFVFNLLTLIPLGLGGIWATSYGRKRSLADQISVTYVVVGRHATEAEAEERIS